MHLPRRGGAVTPPLEKARRLIELATNAAATPHEAANAALAAARLIKAHGLLDLSSARSTRVVVSATVDFEDFLRTATPYQPPVYQRDESAEAEAERTWREAKAKRDAVAADTPPAEAATPKKKARRTQGVRR